MSIFFRLISQRKLKRFKQIEKEVIALQDVHQQAIELIQSIGEGKENSNVTHTDNPLVESLLSMQKQAYQLNQSENQRRWANEGHALFLELLRTQTSDLETLFATIIGELVRYLQANQAGLFIINDTNPNDSFLEQVACYAYERRKYLKKRIDIGDGLVGQCYQESDTLLLTDIPADYVHITSGLGKATPTCLILIPLKTNTQLIGVLEMASFHTLENYHIAFLEKIGESIASTVASLKTNENTRHLLELAQVQTEQLRAQEEEVRQNMEELAATQEELTRQLHESEELKRQLQARERVFNHTTVLSESDLHGTILHVNDKLCQVSKYSREELLGKPHNIFRHPDMPKELFKLMWQTIKQGKVFRGIVKNRAKDGTHYWVDATISPVMDEHNRPIKYVSARYVIPNDRLAETLYQEAIKNLLPELAEKAV